MKSKKMRDRSARWSTVADWFFYVVGSVAYAVSVDMFTVPNHLVPGGVTGISMLLNYAFPYFPIGAGIIVINLPLLVASWFFIGHRFAVRTVFVTILSSVVIDLLAPILPTYTGNTMLAALFGGLLAGVALALIFSHGATTGGSEIVAHLIERRHPHISLGRLMLLVDGIIIAASAVVYGEIEVAMYAAVLVFVCSSVMDAIIAGMHRNNTVLVVCGEGSDIARIVTEETDRGVTVLQGSGAYTGAKRQVLMCALHASEVYGLEKLVQKHDPDAFLIVLGSDRVIGNGFRVSK